MLKSLLIGVNGSQWSRAAAELGVGWARESGLKVTFLGVVDVKGLTRGEPVPIGGGGIKAERDAKLIQAARQRVEDALRDAADLAGKAGVEHATRMVEGAPAEELGLEVQRHDLMIIGRRAIPETDHDPEASETMTEILRHTARPVVVAGGRVPTTEAVVVAYDGSIQAARALGSFVASGLHSDLPVKLVGVDRDVDAMQEKLARAVDFLVTHGRTAEVHVLPPADTIPEALHDFLNRTSPRMLVMGVFGESPIRERLFGSVSRSMVGSVSLPTFFDR